MKYLKKLLSFFSIMETNLILLKLNANNISLRDYTIDLEEWEFFIGKLVN